MKPSALLVADNAPIGSQPSFIHWKRANKTRWQVSHSPEAVECARRAARVRMHIEALEPRFLLSADTIIPGLLASLETGLAGDDSNLGLTDQLQALVDNDDNFQHFVPGVRFDDPNQSPVANPNIAQLFELEVPDPDGDGTPITSAEAIAAIGAGGLIDDATDILGIADALRAPPLIASVDFSLALLDQDNSGRASISEIFDVVVVGQVLDFLEEFPSNKLIFDGVDFVTVATTFDNLVDGYFSFSTNSVGLTSFIDNLSTPGNLGGFIDLSVGNVVNNSVDGIALSYEADISLTLMDDYLIDLGIVADEREISLPQQSFVTGSPVDFGVQPFVQIQSTLLLPLSFSVSDDGTANFSFGVTDDIEFDIFADKDLTGLTVNVGFLGMEALVGSLFSLDIDFDVELVDPSSPVHLGFDPDVFSATGAGEITDSDGLLTASFALTGADVILNQDVLFSLAFGTGALANVFDVVVTAESTDGGDGNPANTSAQDLADDIQAALDLAGLGGLVSAGLDIDDQITLTFPTSDAADLGFNNQENLAPGGLLTADNTLDFTADFSFQPASAIIVSLGGAVPVLVNLSSVQATSAQAGLAGEIERRAEFITTLQAAFNAAGAGGVTVGLDGTDHTELDAGAGTSLEITRTITIAAEFNITSTELANASFDDLFLVRPDFANDNFEINLILHEKAGIALSNGDLEDGLDHQTINLSLDLFQDNGGIAEFALAPGDLRTDATLLQRYGLDDQLLLSGIASSNLELTDSFQKLLDFNVIGGAEVINVINQLKGWLDRLPNTDMLNDFGVPFTEAVLSELLDFGDLIQDKFLVDDLDDDDLDTNAFTGLLALISDLDADIVSVPFATAQELAQRMLNVGLTSTNIADYDVGLKELTYDVQATETLASIVAPVDFEFAPDALEPLFSITAEADIGLFATGAFNATIGLLLGTGEPIDPTMLDQILLADLNNGDGVEIKTEIAVTSATAIDQIFGRLSQDATFKVSVNGAAFETVTIFNSLFDSDGNDRTLLPTTNPNFIAAGSANPTDDNFTSQDLLDDINAQIALTSLNGLIEAVQIADRIALQAASASVSNFVIDTNNNDAAFLELGLQDTTAVTVFLRGAEIADPGVLPASVSFDIEVNGASEIHSVTVNNLGGANTVNDVVNDINDALVVAGINDQFAAVRSGPSVVIVAIDSDIEVFEITNVSDPDLGLSNGDVAGVAYLGTNIFENPANDGKAGVSFGRLTGDAVFSISFDGDPAVMFTVTAGNTADHRGLDDLVDELNTVLGGSGLTAELASSGQIALRVSDATVQSFEITSANAVAANELGFALGETEAILQVIGNRSAPAYFGPETDAHFTINYNDGSPQSVDVILEADETITNRLIFDLVNDVNRALNTAFGGSASNPFVAGFDGFRLVISAKDAGIVSFDITADTSDSAVQDLRLHDIDAIITGGGAPAQQSLAGNNFDLLIFTSDGETHGVTLDNATTLQDVKDAIDGVGLGGGATVLTGLNETLTGLSLEDFTGGSELFRVDSVNGSRAVFGLGIHGADVNVLELTPENIDPATGPLSTISDGIIQGDEINTLDLEDRLFLRQIDADTDILSATVVASVVGVDATASFGFVGVELSGGGILAGDVGIGLADPNGQVFLSDLFDALSTDQNGDNVLDVNDLATLIDFPSFEIIPGNDELIFDVALVGGPIAGIDLSGGTPQISLLINDIGNPFTSTLPDISVTFSDLESLANFENVSFDNILDGLIGLRDFLNQFADLAFLGAEIPVIGISFNDLIEIAQRFSDAVDDITNNPAGSIQLLDQKIRESFGLPPGAGIIDFELVDDMDTETIADIKDMLKLSIDLSRVFSEALDFDLDIGLEIPPFGDISLVGRAGLGAMGGLDAILTVGIDLDDDGPGDTFGEVFVFTHADDTHLRLDLDATAVNISFNAALGPLGVTIIGGIASFTANFNFEDSGAAVGDKVAILDAFDDFDVDLSGMLDVSLPVFFPTQSDFIGDIEFQATLGLSGADGLDVSVTNLAFPDVLDADFFADFDLLSSLPLAADALNLLLDTIQDIMSGEVFGIELPLIGDSLADSVEFIEDLRAGFISPFLDLIENTAKTEQDLIDLVQGFLFALLGPGAQAGDPIDLVLPELVDLASNFSVLQNGLGLLGDLVNPASFADIGDLIPLDVVRNAGDNALEGIEWNFVLADTFNPDLNVAFDLGFPGLGLAVDGGLGLELSYDFGLGFGINLDDGAYINIDRRDAMGMSIPELTLSVDAGFTPNSEIVGSLGFLQFTAAGSNVDLDGNNIDDNNHIGATFFLDLVNQASASDERLSFFELGDLGVETGLFAEATLNLDLELAFDEKLLPDVISAILPALVAGFELDWSQGTALAPIEIGDFDFIGGLEGIKFTDVALDLGSFLGDFLGPIVAQIQEITGPLQPIIDIVTAPIPVISDLAGRDISLVDLAAEFGEFDPGLIFALSDLISFVNSIPATVESIMLPIADEFVIFGSGILSPEQLADATFSFANAVEDGTSSLADIVASQAGDLLGVFGGSGFDPAAFADALGGVSSDTASSVAGVLGGDFDTGDFGFAFPFLENPVSILGALLGNPITFVTYDLPPLVVEFTWEQSFMIYGPLFGNIGVGVGLRIDLAFGYDSLGVQRFAEGGFENPLDLLAGLFISDTNMPDGTGVDVPELQLFGEISVGAELNAGVASAGIQAAIILLVDFDFNDPDGDGKVRIDELVGNFLYEFNFGSPALAPLAIFDISGEVAFQLRAYLKILFAKFTFEITPPITLFEFSIEFDREPILATERGDGSLLLNIGPNAGSRLHGNINDIAETINVFKDGDDLLVWSDLFNVPQSAAQRYSGDSIFGFGGEFNDTINIDSSVDVPVFLEGNSGDDTILAEGSGNAEIFGNDGNDTLTGGSGNDTIFGGAGADTIVGGAGADLIFGDFGRVSDRLISVTNKDEDGDDVISGGIGEDTIFGGGGSDTIGGDGDAFALDAAGDADLIFGDGGRIIFERDGVVLATPEIRSTDSLGDAPDIINAHAGNDVVYGGGGDDIIDGGDDNDTIFGESGFDRISGAAGADTIEGGTEDDVIYGFRIADPVALTPLDGVDTIDGGDGNDFIRGNGDDDIIKGGRGADIIFGDEGADTIEGESGPDFIFGGADSDIFIAGGTGNDIVFGDDGLIVFFDFAMLSFSGSFSGEPGYIINGDGHLVIGDVALDPLDPFASNHDGNFRTLDLILTEARPTDGNDNIVGGEGDDIVLGGDGNDTIFGDFDPNDPPSGPIPADEDILIGDAGRIEFQNRLRDRIVSVVGSAGNDTISGNGGEDVIIGGGNNAVNSMTDVDTLFGRMDPAFNGNPALEEDPAISDDDIIIGDDGEVDYQDGILLQISTTLTDTIDPSLTGGIDIVNGNKGDDIVFGGFAGDILTGSTGEDIIVGDNGQINYVLDLEGLDPVGSRIARIFTTDITNATGGVDTISGDEDNDIILGGAQGDQITGNDADDIIIGDNGEVIYDAIGSADPGRPFLDLVRTTDVQVGGIDTISGGGNKDIVLGGSFGDIIFGDNSLGGIADISPDEDILIGDQGEVEFNDSIFPAPAISLLPAIVRIETTDNLETDGGIDIIEGNEAIDIILGGVQGDILRGNEDDDIILGDEGIVRFDGSLDGVPMSMAGVGFDPNFDNDPFSLDVIATTRFGLGGDDFIFGNENDDIALGGTGADIIIGDNEQSAPGEYGILEDTPGQDILIGDQGRVSLENAGASFANNITRIESTDVLETDGDGDYIEGNDLADIIIGGVNGAGGLNTDILIGEADLPDFVGTPGEDIILGDEGIVRFDVTAAEVLMGAGDDSNATLDQIRTFKTGMMSDPLGSTVALGGVDLIFGNGGDDVAMGGTAGDFIYGDLYSNDATNINFVDSISPGSDSLIGDGGEMRFTTFEVFNGDLNANHVTLLRTIEPDQGGVDTIEGHELGDVILGGFKGDFLFGESDENLLLMASGGSGSDIILGDNGELNWVLASDLIAGRPDVSLITLNANRSDLDRITTTDPTLGGQDRIEGNGSGDVIFGGTDSDLIWGDTPDNDPIPQLADPDAEIDGADGDDLIFGDHGKLYPSVDVVAQSDFLNNNFFSIDTLEADLGNGDIMFGNGADDIMIGGQGDDVMFGNDGDDDMIGGHNVSGGDDDLDALDALSELGLAPVVLSDLNPALTKEVNDIMDGGTDDDVMAGDNAVIIRQVTDESPRFRMLGASGVLHNLTTTTLGGIANIDVGFSANVTGVFQNHLDMTLVRTVFMLDHDDATQDDALNNLERRMFGNDVMVGGLNDDEMFGQLGDDIMQGDGVLSVIVDPAGLAIPYNPAQDADPTYDVRDVMIDGLDTRLRFNVFEDLADGNDYIEGNGGSDRIYGGLGQDDIIGGSSTLFFFNQSSGNEDRPDGADLIYGGAGNPNVLERNAEFGGVNNDITGDTLVTEDVRHAFDADTILGDNGDIFQIVDSIGNAAEFLFEDAAGTFDDGYDSNLTLRVRAVNLVDYGYDYVDQGGLREVLDFLSSARGAGDLIYGETGDDIIHGMTGNDVIFGNSEDDDLYGEIGTDFLLGGTGRDGIVGDDGLILTSRNVALQGEALHGVAPLDPDEGPLRANETVNINSINAEITTPGNIQRAIINVEGELNKSVELFAFRTDDVELTPFAPLFGEGLRFNDIIFGGLGQDFIHAGDGDDAISGAEALPAYYSGDGFGFEDINGFLQAQQQAPGDPDPTLADNPFWFVFAPYNPGDVLRFEGNGKPDEFALYDEFFPRKKIMFDFDEFTLNGDAVVLQTIDDFLAAGGTPLDFLLNFDETEGPIDDRFSDHDPADPKMSDGDDRIFGDLGNDWLVGGTGRDHMWGGRGSDMLNMDDDHDSGAKIFNAPPKQTPGDSLENTLSDEYQAYADIAYGGAGRDVLILNTGADRAIDWVGEFNSYIVPFSPFGAFHISRTLQPQMPEFLQALSDSDGADVFASVGDAALIPAVLDAQLYVDQKNADVRTDDPDPARNFEPFGELGMVRQPDRDWQDQTGAPSDPQPGNLQGQREIMRRELFTDDSGGPGNGGGGNPNALLSFSADVGEWSLSNGAYYVEPTLLGEESISIHHLDQTIPSYVEILVTANLEKDKAGFKSNGYIIFDYQSATDFKFAGIDAGLDKIRIGHRTADGWVIDEQSNLRLKADTDYDLLVALHGTVATVYVNGGNATSFAFGDALNDGLLALGTDNSKTHFDDFQVQKLPPVISHEVTDDFATDSNYIAQTGSWVLAGGVFTGTASTGDTAIATQVLDVQNFARIWIESHVATDNLGGLVFDYYSDQDYKFVAIDAANSLLVIGHVIGHGLVIDTSVALTADPAGHDLSVSLVGTSVSVTVDGTDLLGHSFNGLLNDGDFGLLGHDGETVFDDALLQTDDPAYSNPQAATASSIAVNGAGADSFLTSSQLGPIIQEALRRWEMSGLVSADKLASIDASQFIISDLEGDLLANTQANGTVLIDATAAGHGWFVDTTPSGDEEFYWDSAAGKLIAKPTSDAAGRIDILSVFMHEIGHLLGFDHDAGSSLLSAELDVGTRLSPDVAGVTDNTLNAEMIEDQILIFDGTSGELTDYYGDEQSDNENIEYVDLLIEPVTPSTDTQLPRSQGDKTSPLHSGIEALTSPLSSSIEQSIS